MKKLFTLLLALIMVFSLAACDGDDNPSDNDVNNNSDTSQTTNQNGGSSIGGGSIGGSDIEEDETSGAENNRNQIDTNGKTWDDLDEYTTGIPKPGFVKDSPLVLESLGDKLLRFQANDGTTEEDVRAYISEMENEGFVVETGTDTTEMYNGSVKSEDGKQILNFSYSFGQISIDVPIYYDDGADENADASENNNVSEETNNNEPDNSSEEVESIDWPDNDYTNLVPEPEGATIISGGEVGGYMFRLNMTMPLEDAQIYAQQLADSGFEGTEEMWENINTYSYNGTNADGWTVTFSWRDGEVTYNIKKP